MEYQYGTPVVTGDLLVSGGNSGCMAVLRAQSGECLWTILCWKAIIPAGWRGGGERIFVTTPSGTVRCHDLQSGELRWTFQTGADLLDLTPYKRGISSILAAPVVSGGVVLVGANDGVLYALDENTGQLMGQNAFGVPLSAAPVVLEEGVCVGTWDERFYWFGG